jgi:hypothetical protein
MKQYPEILNESMIARNVSVRLTYFRKINPYIWLLLGVCVLCAVFFCLYMLTMKKFVVIPVKQVNTEETNPDRAVLFNSAASYDVIEDFKMKNAETPQFSFGPLQIAKSKLPRGMQFMVKESHILDQYETPDKHKMIYFVQRLQKQEKRKHGYRLML